MQGRNMTAHDRHPSASQAKPQPRVNKSPRRATRACDDCRRLKEKCIGTVPCDRCKKSGRSCQFSNSFRRTRVSRAASTSKTCPGNRAAAAADSSAFFEIERIQALEQIARYYTGLEQCSLENLKEVIGNFAQDEGLLLDVEVDDGSSDGREDAMEALTPASSGKWS
ncbi:hypothetical protein FSOLCH5_006881 [Fusarium solani]